MAWFFQSKKKLESSSNPIKDPTKQKLENPNLNTLKHSGFIGNHSESPDKQFLIAWLDGDLDAGVFGSRKKGNGKFIVIENGKIILRGEAERPNDCKIANNGVFVINDWLFNSRLNSKFYAKDKMGKEIVAHHFSANLKANCISNDGRFAVAALANSKSKDSGLLALFDLEQGSLIKRIYPEDDAGSLLSVSSVDKTITLDYQFETFRYTFDGVFLDRDKLQQAHIESGSVFDLLRIAEEKLKDAKQLNEGSATEIILLLNKSLAKGLDEYPKQKAQAYRLIGQANEAIENISEAIINYDLALNIDPKIGIKRRLDTLKKTNLTNR
ncbi:MAG: hypothetical protein HQK65_22725 [Desulfamplus sp.]|nr:hypothetical protein [Desulfamplus sp.]